MRNANGEGSRKGGVGKDMREACKRAGKTLVSFGCKYMGEINELPSVLKLVEEGQLGKLSRVNSAQTARFHPAHT